jgi:hypothetical protein
MNPKVAGVGILLASFCFQVFAKGEGGSNAVVFEAAANGDVAKLKHYFATRPEVVSLRNDLLRTAVVRGQGDAAEFLLSKGAEPNSKDAMGMTPLAQMAMCAPKDNEKSARVASILLAHGAQVDPVDTYQITPLLHAVESQKSQLTKALLDHGADLHRRYVGVKSGMTALHLAVMNNDKATVAVLLRYKAPLNAVDQDGATPLLIAEARNETDIAAMVRSSDPDAAKGTPTYSVPPTKEQMRALARRISEGDNAAFNELAAIAKKLYGEIKDYQKERVRVMVLMFRMHTAFDVLGTQAGQGNEKALAALKKCLEQKGHLQSFAPDALGIAAAGGNKEALDILLHYERWGILESSANFALCMPAEANVAPAVDYVSNWLLNMNPFQRNGGMMVSATNALGKAAAKGNEKAKETLEKFAANSARTVK